MGNGHTIDELDVGEDCLSVVKRETQGDRKNLRKLGHDSRGMYSIRKQRIENV